MQNIKGDLDKQLFQELMYMQKKLEYHKMMRKMEDNFSENVETKKSVLLENLMKNMANKKDETPKENLEDKI